MKQLYDQAEQRHRELCHIAGRAKVHFIWEHEFDFKLQSNKDMREFVEGLDLRKEMGPRDCYFGGRTEPFVLRYDVKEGEKILCMDINSL